jgi:H/ACA ribonucleoprotein complex subunit 3
MKQILKCENCKEYTLKEACKCGGKAVTVRPAKFSPDDRHAKYRRTAKQEERKQKGLI